MFKPLVTVALAALALTTLPAAQAQAAPLPLAAKAGQAGLFGTKLTAEKFAAIKTGMSYAQVKKIIGFEGAELSRSELAGYVTVMYSWSNPGGSNMNAMFQNGKLIQKAQFGL